MLKDINFFKPKFIRIVREKGDIIIFDFHGTNYFARDIEKYGKLNLMEYIISLMHDHAIYEYHISLESSIKGNAILVFESDLIGGEKVILKLARLVRDRNLKFILKSSGNRSLHLCIPVETSGKEDYSFQWNYFYSFLDINERKFIDQQLNNIGGQIRGFESLHLKTYNKSNILK